MGTIADRALWITWYDLPPQHEAPYLTWLHERYIPMLLGRSGYLWAAHYDTVPKSSMSRMRSGKGVLRNTPDESVPAGSRFILLVGGADAHVFGDPTPRGLHAALPDADRAMLALRAGERVGIMIEAARVEGPEAGTYTGGMALPPCIQLGSFNCERDEEDMLAWYAQCRMPAMRTLPGCIRTRRLVSAAGWAKHAILYEFVSLELRNRYFIGHEHDPETIAWGDRVVDTLTHAPGSANLAQRLWPPV